MASISSLVLTGEHILVRAMGGCPFDSDVAPEKQLVEPVFFNKQRTMQSCWGTVIAAGPSPYMKDDCSPTEKMISAGDLVIFPPTSGFQVPAPEGFDDEYRIMAASVVAGVIPSA